MELKDLYKMTKADRYTADGCEELNKAREADVEDKTYQIGEISQKTGLQKTANGWVKPKSVKQAGAKKQEEPKNVHGAEVDAIYERQLKRIKELKAKGFTDEQIDNDKIIKQTKEDMHNVGKKPESKPDTMQEMRNAERPIKTAAQIITRGDLDDAIINSARDEEALQDIARDLLSPAFDAIGEDIPDNYMEFATDLIKNRYEVLEERATGDSAPRVLTGDTKIRVRK